MLRRLAVTLLGILGLSLSPVAPAGNCKLAPLLEIPVTMHGTRPLVSVQINGTDTLFVADSGAFYSMMSPAAAAELKLKVRHGPRHLYLRGVGGIQHPDVGVVDEMRLGGVTFTKPWEFLVGAGNLGAAGILGQNIFRAGDVEYDLANGVIRLWKPEGNCHSTRLVYWLKEGQEYSEMNIQWATPTIPHTQGEAALNGHPIHVLFDTGAAVSMLTLRAATLAGIKPDSPGVTSAGTVGGVGRGAVESWIGPFESFKVGEEEVRHTRLRFGDIDIGTDMEMAVGADFFLSHRVYVASSQHKLYFTYNGGPVFNLNTNTLQAGDPAANPPAQGGAAPPNPGAVLPSDAPTTADGFSRRGAASAARRDFVHAIADLTRAVELAPTEPEYFYERAQAYDQNKQPELAGADLDQALKLKPDHLPALIARAQRRAGEHNDAGARADLDAADHAARPQEDKRLAMGEIYAQANQFAQSVAQYNLWIAVHDDDPRIAYAYSMRCHTRALWGQELDKALSDCNQALRWNSRIFVALDSRGLIRLRQGDFGHAVSDYSDALKLEPHNPWTLYGRGLAQEHQKNAAAASAGDLAAATAQDPHIGDEFKRLGLTP